MNRRRNQSQRPPPLPVLHEDLIVEILSRLPVKPLLQFRCVCKSWKSLISNPNFVKLHLQRSSKNPNLILTVENASSVPCTVRGLLDNPSSSIVEDGCYPLKNEKSKYLVVGSCNGLVCMLGFYNWNMPKQFWVRLWNPATRLISEKLAFLPVVESRILYSRLYRFIKFAFGYDNLTDTYKVVAVHMDLKAEDNLEKTQVRVYSFGDSCWKKIQSFPLAPVVDSLPGLNDGIYLCGTLNWLASLVPLVYNPMYGYQWKTIAIDHLVIVSLDMGKETYRQLLLPRGVNEVSHIEPTLRVLMDCLCFSHDCERSHFVVWQMKDFGVENSWTQLVKVRYQYLRTHDFFPSSSVLPLCMSNNGDFLIIANYEESEAILYNRRDNSVQRTAIPDNICWTDAKEYVESLVSPCCTILHSSNENENEKAEKILCEIISRGVLKRGIQAR